MTRLLAAERGWVGDVHSLHGLQIDLETKDSECVADFQAAKEVSLASTKYKFRGFGALYCAHSFSSAGVNCFKGEQAAYILLMLAETLKISVEVRNPSQFREEVSL